MATVSSSPMSRSTCRVRTCGGKQLFDLTTFAEAERLDAGDRLAAPDDGELLATVLDGIEDGRKASCGFGCAHLRHEIRLSDRCCDLDRFSGQQSSGIFHPEVLARNAIIRETGGGPLARLRPLCPSQLPSRPMVTFF